MINLTDIYNTVKPSLIKGAIYKDIFYDIKATAWEYAYIKSKGYKSSDYNEMFLKHYKDAYKTLNNGDNQ